MSDCVESYPFESYWWNGFLTCAAAVVVGMTVGELLKRL